MSRQLCNLCPRKCNAIRTERKNIGGYCQMPALPVIARAALHFGEEPCISGKNGSGTIFFSGCNMKCVFCQNAEISRYNKGITVDAKRLSEIFYELECKNAHNINLVSANHYIDVIKEAISIYKPKIPLVYNTSSYDNSEMIKQDIFDVYLMDLKYYSDEKALKYSNAPDYFSVASKAIKEAYRICGENKFDDDGILKRGVIVRHLLLPLATNEAIKIIDWFCDNTPDAIFSLMAQYTPLCDPEKYPEISRKITKREYDKVSDYLIGKNIKNAYVQELSSSSEKFIPIFNGYGVKKLDNEI